jgi:hypothetical protein
MGNKVRVRVSLFLLNTDALTSRAHLFFLMKACTFDQIEDVRVFDFFYM